MVLLQVAASRLTGPTVGLYDRLQEVGLRWFKAHPETGIVISRLSSVGCAKWLLSVIYPTPVPKISHSYLARQQRFYMVAAAYGLLLVLLL